MIDLKNILKSTTLIFVASVLFACQDDSSAGTQTTQAPIEKSVAPVEQSNAIAATTANSVPIPQTTLAQAETVVKEVVASTPRAPADFSTLNKNTYHLVPQPFAVSTGDSIEVAELFWFGCSHCFELEPYIKSWAKNNPANAKFKKVPAIFSKRWEFHGKAFYTMESLNVPEQAYDDFFSRIHVQQRSIGNLNSLVQFLAPYGKDQTTVENTFNSFAVDSKLRNAVKITRASGARGVPAIIVDGKYLTSQSDAGGTRQMFDVVDKLIAKAASER